MCMPTQGAWAGVDALPCCAAAAKAEEAAVVRSDDVTPAGQCSDSIYIYTPYYMVEVHFLFPFYVTLHIHVSFSDIGVNHCL